MRRYKLTLLATAAALGLAMQLAAAADLPRKAPVYAPPPPPPADWSGVYVGLEGGYGWGKQDLNAVVPGDCFYGCDIRFPDVAVQSGTQKGWLFGGFAGAQKQWGSWVLGIEADFDGANLKNSEAASATSLFRKWGTASLACGQSNTLCLTQSVAGASKVDMLGSVRGKVGFVVAPDWLIYGTGGIAYAHVKNAFADTETVQDGTETPFTEFTGAFAGGTSMVGWAAGAGVDWKFWHDAGSAWIFGVEYLHYGFGEHTITLSDVPNSGFNTVSFNTNEKVDTIKGRISYLFSIH